MNWCCRRDRRLQELLQQSARGMMRRLRQVHADHASTTRMKPVCTDRPKGRSRLRGIPGFWGSGLAVGSGGAGKEAAPGGGDGPPRWRQSPAAPADPWPPPQHRAPAAEQPPPPESAAPLATPPDLRALPAHGAHPALVELHVLPFPMYLPDIQWRNHFLINIRVAANDGACWADCRAERVPGRGSSGQGPG